jgi:hypothetical protein
MYGLLLRSIIWDWKGGNVMSCDTYRDQQGMIGEKCGPMTSRRLALPGQHRIQSVPGIPVLIDLIVS